MREARGRRNRSDGADVGPAKEPHAPLKTPHTVIATRWGLTCREGLLTPRRSLAVETHHNGDEARPSRQAFPRVQMSLPRASVAVPLRIGAVVADRHVPFPAILRAADDAEAESAQHHR